jgi:hypothetical protein
VWAWVFVLVAAGGLWVRTLGWVDSLGYTWGVARPDDTQARVPGWWLIRLRTVTLTAQSGRVAVTYSTYLSGGPDRGQLEAQWAPSMGWKGEATRRGSVHTWGPWFAWKPWSDVVALGLGVGGSGGPGYSASAVQVPLWLPMLLGAGYLGRRWWQNPARRVGRGLCAACAYPRAGLEGWASCPECGAAGPTPHSGQGAPAGVARTS